MSQVNYAAMSDQELRRYFLSHREDAAAFQAYLERRRARHPLAITAIDDPDFDDKLQESIRQQTAAHQNSSP